MEKLCQPRSSRGSFCRVYFSDVDQHSSADPSHVALSEASRWPVPVFPDLGSEQILWLVEIIHRQEKPGFCILTSPPFKYSIFSVPVAVGALCNILIQWCVRLGQRCRTTLSGQDRAFFAQMGPYRMAGAAPESGPEVSRAPWQEGTVA